MYKSFCRRERVLRDLLALVIFAIFTFVFNYSILLGLNGMKFDIIDAYYPLCMLSADMLRNGRLPLWSCSLLFGTPVYAMIGIPFWYPTTLAFEFFTGYSYRCIAWDYAIHILVASFGTYKLVLESIDIDDDKIKYYVSLSAGVLYGFSGPFVSNAGHIMIIISAAWLPWTLFLSQKYLKSNNIKWILLAGAAQGLSILGGYPEIWVDTFLILIPYFFVFTKDSNILHKILRSVKGYTLFAINSLLAAAITIIPFINQIKYMTRMKNGIHEYASYSWYMFLSTILPDYTRISDEIHDPIDISMISGYIGIISLLLLVVSVRYSFSNKKYYYCMIVFSILMIMGKNGFIFPLFHEFFPGYNTFRFPTLWRCEFGIFVLLISSNTMCCIWKNHSKTDFNNIVLSALLIIGLTYIGTLIFNQRLTGYSDTIQWLDRDIILSTCFVGFYLVIMYVLCNTHFNFINRKIYILPILVFFEVFVFQQMATYPVTVTQCNQLKVWMMGESEKLTDKFIDCDKERVHDIDYKNSYRTRSGLDSKTIVFGHTLDEEGYLSVERDYVQQYSNSTRCCVKRDMPEVYWTNKIITSRDISLDKWLKSDADENIIYMDNSELKNNESNGTALIKVDSFISGDIEFTVEGNADGYAVIQQSVYPGWNATLDNKPATITEVDGALMGIYIPSGEHKVRLKFRPKDFIAGSSISIVYWLTMIVFVTTQTIHIRRGDKNAEKIAD